MIHVFDLIDKNALQANKRRIMTTNSIMRITHNQMWFEVFNSCFILLSTLIMFASTRLRFVPMKSSCLFWESSSTLVSCAAYLVA